MASRKKKKRVGRKPVPQVRKKVNPERELAKALKDLGKIFPKKTLGRQFKIKPWQVSLYAKYKKRKPLPKKKQKAIMAFYKKLQRTKHHEDLRYAYSVSRAGRITPVKWIPAAEVLDLIRKQGVKKTAKTLNVSQDTVLRWKSGRFTRIKAKNREKLFKARQRSVHAGLDGIFFLQRDRFQSGDNYFYASYSFIEFQSNLLMTRDEFLVYMQNKNYFRIKDSAIKTRYKFTEAEATRFIDHLATVKSHGDPALFQDSVYAINSFIDREFSGKVRERLTGHIDATLTKRKKKRTNDNKQRQNRRVKAKNIKSKKSKTKKNVKKTTKNPVKNNKKQKNNRRKTK